MFEVTFSPKANKALKKIPKEYQIKIQDAAGKLRLNPFNLDIEKLHEFSRGTHRLRVGNYRLFLRIDMEGKTIMVSTIRRRTTQTYRR